MQVLFGLVGAGVGSLLGNPALGWSIGTLIGGSLFGEKQSGGETGRIGDQRIQGATQGTPIAIVYGRERVAGNIMWASGILESESDQSTGGKKGGAVTTTVTNVTSLGIMIARGNPSGKPDLLLRRIWSNNEVIYSERPELGEASPVLSEKLGGSTVEFYPGTETQLPDPTIQADKGVADTPAFLGRCYVVHAGLILNKLGNSIPNLAYEIDSGTWTVEEVLLDICDMVGISSADCDFSAVAGINVAGFVIPARTEARAAWATLCDMYNFDIVEYDGLLRAVVRGGSSAYTIEYDELAGVEGHSVGTKPGQSRIQIARTQEVELPRSVIIGYHSEESDFQQFTQRADVRTRTSDEEDQLSFMAVLTDAEARELAEIRARARWKERDKLNFVTTYRMIKMAPGDVATVQLNSGGSLTKTVQILSIQGVSPGLIHVIAKSVDPKAYIQSVDAASVDSSPGGVFVPSQAYWALSEAPAAYDSLTDDTFLVAAAGRLDSGWTGGLLYENGYGFWDPVRTFFESSSTFGTASDALPSASTYVIDDTNTVTVALSGGGPLQSYTRDQLLSGANLALLGGEYIAFQTAVETSPNVFQLSGLRRGLRGTEQKVGTHVIGEVFILMNGKERWFTYPFAFQGETLEYHLYDNASSASLGNLTTPTLACLTRRPYSPVLLESVRDGGTNDCALTWVRRARKNGDLQNYDDAPLDEPSEVYTVKIYTPGSVLKRTVTVTGVSSFAYTSAMQTTDLGAPGPFKFTVAQNTTVCDVGDGEFAPLYSAT